MPGATFRHIGLFDSGEKDDKDWWMSIAKLAWEVQIEP
tara:strand:- start:510 stop:623 length:114 start_codon:yes stop_codon:yes gene_type:complete